MMIFFILAIVCLTAADPIPRPGAFAADEVEAVEGALYGFPMYEDPDMAIFQLSDIGAMPVLTVLDVARKPEDSPKQEDSTYNDQLTEILKKDLDDVTSRLQVARSKLEEGNTNIFIDVDKSIHNLKNIEHHLLSNPSSPTDSTNQPLPVTAKGDTGSFTTEELETTNSKATTTTTEIPKSENSSIEKTVVVPLGGSVLIAETSKYEEAEIAGHHKKWTWKSSSIV